MIDGEQNHDQPEDETAYVGAPTEYADSQEMPDWVQSGVKVLVAIPALIATLSVIELVLFCGVAVVVVLVALFFIVL
ncbi:hypothetical protein [Aggregatilinea lenta]|uniref:hypothetical protein n=1 Tax=Aggregatilinea lenta TaxID=913108 RepID=UPI000E5C3C32|nr:hypothetical protein [Aggregatilinea lenta]